MCTSVCICVQVCACVYSGVYVCAWTCIAFILFLCMCVHVAHVWGSTLNKYCQNMTKKVELKQWLQVNESPSTLHQLCTLAVLQKLVIATNVAHIPAREVQRSHPSRKRWHIHSIAPSPLRSVSPHVWDMTVGLTGSLTLRTADLALAQSLVPGANRRRRRPRHTTLEAVWKWKEQRRMSGCAKQCQLYGGGGVSYTMHTHTITIIL